MNKTQTLGLSIAASAALSFALVSSSQAANCTETVTALTLNGEGQIFFSTSQNCVSVMCYISFSTADANKEAYASLSAALITGQQITFSWPSLASCGSGNPQYAVPAYFTVAAIG